MTPTLLHINRADGTFVALGDPGDFAAYGHSSDHHAGAAGENWADPVNGGTASSQWVISRKLAETLAFRGAGDP